MLRAPRRPCETFGKPPLPSGYKSRSSTPVQSAKIHAAFAALESDRADALFVAPDAFFASRAVQFVTLTARDKMPAAYSLRAYVTAGGLMKDGADFANLFRQVGDYTGKILKGAKPADLPVLQSTKFELVINLKTAQSDRRRTVDGDQLSSPTR